MEKFNYYYIEVNLLKSVYAHDVARLDEMRSWHRKTSQFPRKSEIGCDCLLSNENEFFKWYFPLKAGSVLLIEFNFRKLHQGFPQVNYDSMMTALVKSLAYLETTTTCGCAPKMHLSEGFSQQLLKKLKERIPMPAAIPQPGSGFSHVKEQSTFMLLDDDIDIKIDNVDKTLSDTKFEYEWQGTKIMSFRRNSTGLIQQNGFSVFNNGLPNNNYATSTYKLSSFADIQASEALKGKYYVALYHPPLKRNNDHGAAGNTGMYAAADDNNRAIGNALLVHFNSQELSTLDFTDPIDDGDAYAKSFFSPRGSIAPMIKIFINGRETYADFDLHPTDIGHLPRKYKLYRKSGGRYRRVKGATALIFLQPHDHIKYKL